MARTTKQRSCLNEKMSFYSMALQQTKFICIVGFGILKMSVKIALKAYLKILLHCHKYPYRAINGVLIGKAKQKVALDCIPLFHQSLQLSPMIEIALLQVKYLPSCAYCRPHTSTQPSVLDRRRNQGAGWAVAP